ncbi:unnamed protein product [Schistosoma mattheei]|uniref:Uncharacterized protein n=1 Tax=Schistosoma mattheei TaxID=31246 RepID=A0A3P8I9G6_9TREM|nr:unnamed protein product [Schistosoma mattheei]
MTSRIMSDSRVSGSITLTYGMKKNQDLNVNM